ncbi:MAG TPA: sugar transferase [Kofleriaceae bacterium]|nr:sugar transferase [Kofleriaceae bacterium]
MYGESAAQLEREVPQYEFDRVRRQVVPPRRALFVVTSEIREIIRTNAQRMTKRAVDACGSFLALVLLSPLFLIAMLAVRLSGRGPVFFVHDRCGLNGRLFRFYKFRTMVVDAEARKAELAHLNEVTGPAFKIKRDPRITRVGAVLRKLSIDELPQLWNVLKGDMSLVGPRPPTPDEVERYTSRQVQRLAVVPGITGLWQVSGRSSIADFDQWIELDLRYAHTWSIWLDLRILLKTPAAVLRMQGAE